LERTTESLIYDAKVILDRVADTIRYKITSPLFIVVIFSFPSTDILSINYFHSSSIQSALTAIIAILRKKKIRKNERVRKK
jgi:hypothetical protein